MNCLQSGVKGKLSAYGHRAYTGATPRPHVKGWLNERPPTSHGAKRALGSLKRRLKLFGAVASIVAVGYYVRDTRAAVHGSVVAPLLQLLDPEDAHRWAIKLGKLGLYPKESKTSKDSSLMSVDFFGTRMENPIGLAAGFDKNAEALDALLDLGFGFVEAGTVTPRPQPGNQRPRVFRIPEDAAVINRYGLNSQGAAEVRERLLRRMQRFLCAHRLSDCPGLLESCQLWSSALRAYFDSPAASEESQNVYWTAFKDWTRTIKVRAAAPTNDALEAQTRSGTALERAVCSVESSGVPFSLRPNKLVGINLGKNKTSPANVDDDYVSCVEQLGCLADYIVLNVSCPNVTNLGSGTDTAALESTLERVRAARDALPRQRKPPLLAKISPDLTENQLAEVARLSLQGCVDGVVISNTTTQRPLKNCQDPSLQSETGGLSGVPLKELALESIRKFYRMTNGKVTIIGVGGIASAEDCLEFANAGATMVQLYTSLAYHGAGHVTRIKCDLAKLLEQRKTTWAEQIGASSA